MDKLERLKQLETKVTIQELKKQLPHKYSPLYKWQREGVDSLNKINLITAGNQMGKSVWLMIRAITHATETELWPTLWPKMMKEGKSPTQFWYLYEDRAMIMREFETKWVREWLPRGEARYKGKYRWTWKRRDKCVEYIHFLESDVKIYFFSYGQGVDALMASTVYEIFVDEEIPFEQYDELSARLTITRGYFNAGFTAVKGQEEWRRAMEETGEEELFKTAFKQQISAFECKVKEDGSPGLWDDELIEIRIAQCSTDNMVLQKIYGKFVKAEGLKVPQFEVKRHFVKGHRLNAKKWVYWSAIDPGSGGSAHPAGILLLAVNEECTKGRVIRCWRGDKINTSNTQILQKHQEMVKGFTLQGTVYDKQCRDLYLQAVALDIPLIPANKARDEGFGVVNSLFKHDMLKIYYGEKTEFDQGHKLKNELLSYSERHSKSKATCPDNLIDPLRYISVHIPWNFDTVIKYNIEHKEERKTVMASEREELIRAQKEGRLVEYLQSANEQHGILSNELSEWNEYFDEFYE